MLTRLRDVDLHDNRIQTLEPWIYYVAINGQRDNRVPINLGYNNISTFTNMMGWKAKCGMRPVQLELTLTHNPIKHITDILRGWNISLLTWWCLSPHIGITSSHVYLRDVWLDCDCIDFAVIKLVLFIQKLVVVLHNHMLNGVYCSRPASLFRMEVSTVPLDQFVCDLTEHCPPGCHCVHQRSRSMVLAFGFCYHGDQHLSDELA